MNNGNKNNENAHPNIQNKTTLPGGFKKTELNLDVNYWKTKFLYPFSLDPSE
jgi:hypothetical protein